MNDNLVACGLGRELVFAETPCQRFDVAVILYHGITAAKPSDPGHGLEGLAVDAGELGNVIACILDHQLSLADITLSHARKQLIGSQPIRHVQDVLRDECG